MRKNWPYFLLTFLFTGLLNAQILPEKGVPLLKNYTPEEYHNKGKIWEISSAPNGLIFMAADKGLLEFDGETWNAYKGSSGFTRSLFVLNDSIIFTGSDLDFGIWKKNKLQGFEYKSLYPFTKDINDINEEFWDIQVSGDNIIFVSRHNIYVYKNQQLTKIAAPYKFSGCYKVNDTLYFADEKNGIYTLNGVILKQEFRFPENKSFQVSGIYRYKTETIIVTKNSGLYSFSSGIFKNVDNLLSQTLKLANVFSFEQIESKYLVFGTIQKGMYITNLDGKVIHHINKQKGLPNNTILSLHFSRAGNLWLGMDYGITAINLKNNLTYFYDFRGDFGTGYAAILKDNTFYLGTNQGLYHTDWDDLNDNKEFNKFRLVNGTEGQVWTLKEIDNQLFIGHDLGLFVLKDNVPKKLSDQRGIWNIIQYNDFLLTGTYTGISIFRKSGESWIFMKNMELILGSCNQIVIEKDSILWVNIPNFGVIRAELKDDFYPNNRIIFHEDIFDGSNPYILQTDTSISVVTEKYQYHYDQSEQKFSLPILNENNSVVKGRMSDIFQPTYLNDDYKFYSVYNGFALKYLNNTDTLRNKNYSLILRKAEAFNNNERVPIYDQHKIPFFLNNIKIVCIVPNVENVLYQYKLNENGNWTPWISKNVFEFLNLKEGKYKLFVRAKIDSQKSNEITVLFKIAAPWYRSWYAWLSYFFMVLILVYFIREWQKLSLKKQKKKLLKKEQSSLRQQAEKHKQEVLILEQEQLKSEVELMKQKLKSKTIELASKAKDNEDKNRLLLNLKEKLEDSQRNPSKSIVRWSEMQRLLDAYLNVDDKTFEIQMDELHQEFFKKIKESFPGLSNYELRLCAYLKIGLNSKEIADLLNVQPSSTFISRSRLRKKLNLTPEQDLYDFLNAL
ncbi:MAG: hypothetical protein IPM42_19350 [Saprospiraceae bacterium]|nr:hypothetical protein [Saprospiraceae bacterium]